MATRVILLAAATGAVVVRQDLRTDGVPVMLMEPGQLEAEFALQLSGGSNYPFKPFSAEYVAKALKTETDWRTKGLVTPAKDQGAHGYCGTFGRVAAAEGQFAMRSQHGLRNFSEEELVDCIGWDKDQFSYFSDKGFMDTAIYPYNTTGPDMDPPIPGHPCLYNKNEVIKGTADGKFNNMTGAAPSEDQLVAFLHHNGPVQTGINANVLGMRAKGCEQTGDCFITEAMCNDPKIKGKPIDHSITLVGYGTDKTSGDYWIVKNSWSTAFANAGFIKVARGISCASIDCCGNTFVYGDASKYYEE
jgi:cathepsin L